MRLYALDDLYMLFCRGFGGGFGFPENISEVDCAEGIRIILLVIRLQCVKPPRILKGHK